MNKLILFLLLLVSFSAYIFYNHRNLTPLSPYVQYASLIPHTYRVGFTNLNKEVVLKTIPVKGIIPQWLSGTLLRNGPAKFTQDKSFVSNWFDGLAMIHAFSFDNGTVSYANKFLRSSDYETVQKTGTMSYAGFAQDPCRSLFKRFTSLFIAAPKQYVPNANVNIALYSNTFIALTETPLPILFDPTTLETLGVFHYKDTFPETKIHESAHPHYDAQRKEHISYLTLFGQTSKHVLYRIKDGTTERKEIASIKVDRPSYMHSFALTQHYAILTALPLVVNPLDLLLKRQAFIKNFTWQPERGTNFIVIDRIHDTIVGQFKGPAFFTFHHVNAFEKDNTIIMDMVTYPNAQGVGKALFKDLLAPCKPRETIEQAGPDAEVIDAAKLTRYTLNITTGTITAQKISNELIELPRINYDSYNGKEYTYVYAVGKRDPQLSYVFDTLVKINVTTQEVHRWYEQNCYPGEPVFVPSPEARFEDDGVLLSVVLDAKKERSFLLILNAHTLKELGRAELSHHIPFGIHGMYSQKSKL